MTEAIENRESFTQRLTPLVPPGQILDIDLAYTLSKYVHRAQVRMETNAVTGQPLRYFEHPRRVALILLDTVGITDPVMICAALLHDTVEDSDELSPAAIERYWGVEVARLVQLLSKVPKEGYIERLNKHGDWRAILIKACDRLDNLRSLDPADVSGEFRLRQAKETKEFYIPLFQKMLTEVPRQYEVGAKLVVNEVIALAHSAA